jgi:hypothetical protein
MAAAGGTIAWRSHFTPHLRKKDSSNGADNGLAKGGEGAKTDGLLGVNRIGSQLGSAARRGSAWVGLARLSLAWLGSAPAPNTPL